MYWEQRVDCSFPTVAALMSRNRFEDLLRYFHVADNNNLDPSDKFAKVRPLWKLLNARWVKYYPGDKNLSIDESMIPYYGKHGTKQHIHGKPIRFGYKSWSICTRLGYLIYVASTQCGSEPISKVKRYCDKQKKDVDQPRCFVNYNKFMGGVDRLDQNVGCYRIAIRLKRWYWQLLMFPLNVSVNNAFQLYKISPAAKKSNAPSTFTISNPKSSLAVIKRVPDAIRLDEHDHSVLRLPPYHSDLNQIEMAWAAIKGYVASKNIKWNVSHVMDLVKEKVALMGAEEWAKLCHKVKNRGGVRQK
ncbi:hypothetical protein HF086_009106 [Spodoptera exigua]|uniref:PiggyBac transposable element-derived protein domain-containing protein n=1 Tax=Spodoptera exigua TaxID=7107 RepID=A0A922MN19_SPOEX|nr:hypothetical protein HF086_009106 [Spodoptera exigua]